MKEMRSPHKAGLKVGTVSERKTTVIISRLLRAIQETSPAPAMRSGFSLPSTPTSSPQACCTTYRRRQQCESRKKTHRKTKIVHSTVSHRAQLSVMSALPEAQHRPTTSMPKCHMAEQLHAQKCWRLQPSQGLGMGRALHQQEGTLAWVLWNGSWQLASTFA